jgi:anti-sigma factor RsiW
MDSSDHSTYRDSLYQDRDGSLTADQKSRLQQHLSSCPECQTEEAQLDALEGLLTRSRLSVAADFRDGVLAALPPAGWEARHPRTWSFPAAVFLLFGGIATAIFGSGGSHVGRSPSGVSALVAVAEMFHATMLAGAGLLAASWKGLGMVVASMLSSSTSLGAFGVFVLCLNLLLLSLIKKRRPAAPGIGSRLSSRGSESGV